MATFKSAQQLIRNIKSRFKRSRLKGKDLVNEAGYHMWNEVRDSVPQGGDLQKSLTWWDEEDKKGDYQVFVEIGYFGNKNFPVARFVNQEFTIKGRPPWFQNDSTVRYGVGGLSAAGNPITWRATKNPFWEKAKESTRRKFPGVTVRDISKAFHKS
jgi:hypothetical protein